MVAEKLEREDLMCGEGNSAWENWAGRVLQPNGKAMVICWNGEGNLLIGEGNSRLSDYERIFSYTFI